MKRILLGLNVGLDVLLERESWFSDAAALWKANDARALRCHLTASPLTDVFCIAKDIRGAAGAREAVGLCLEESEARLK